MNADDRLSLDPLGRVEGGDGVIEGRDVADVRPHSSVTCPPDNLTQLGAIGYDDEVNRQAVSGPRLGRAGDGLTVDFVVVPDRLRRHLLGRRYRGRRTPARRRDRKSTRLNSSHSQISYAV